MSLILKIGILLLLVEKGEIPNWIEVRSFRSVAEHLAYRLII